MSEVLTRLKQKIVDLWQNLDKSQKTRVYITSGILIVAIVASIVLLTRTNYVPLIGNADPKDIKEMTTILDSKNIKYKLTSNNSGLMVSSKDNDSAQIALLDFPKTGMSFESAISLLKINSTESDKKHVWNAYEESKMKAKLMMLDNVKDAQVDLAIPDQSAFFETNSEMNKPTASVTITPNGNLTPKQVQGIALLVARSVVNLDPKNVIVTDNNGNILSSESGDDSIDRTNTQYEMKQKVKDDLEKSIRDMYMGSFEGFDTIRVVANPVLDFDKVKSQTHQYSNPDGLSTGVVISNETNKETVVNGDTAAEPGVETNPGTDTTTYPNGSGDTSSYDKSSSKTNYGVNETSTESEKAQGKLLTDESTMSIALWYGKRVTEEDKINSVIADVQNAASRATGIPVANISITKYRLDVPEPVPVKVSDTVKSLVESYGFFALMLFLIIGLLIAALPRRKPAEEPESEYILESVAATTGPRFIVPEMTKESIPEIGLEEKSEVKKQIEKFVKQKPDSVAQLLRNWLSDEWD